MIVDSHCHLNRLELTEFNGDLNQALNYAMGEGVEHFLTVSVELEDVEELKEFLQLHKFDRVGIFTYSHEENTSAYDLVDDVPAEEKQRRAEEIMEVQQEISLAINQAKEGQTLKVIIDKKEAGRWLGRTQFDSVEVDNEVVINTTKRLKAGDMVMVKITKAYDYDLEGELV